MLLLKQGRVSQLGWTDPSGTDLMLLSLRTSCVYWRRKIHLWRSWGSRTIVHFLSKVRTTALLLLLLWLMLLLFSLLWLLLGCCCCDCCCCCRCYGCCCCCRWVAGGGGGGGVDCCFLLEVLSPAVALLQKIALYSLCAHENKLHSVCIAQSDSIA